MKRKNLLALLLALVMVLSLAACGGKSSNVSIDDYEESFLHLFGSDEHFTVKKGLGGHTFNFSGDFFGIPLSIKGTADKRQMVKQVTVTVEGAPTDYFQEATALTISADIVDMMSVPVGQLAADCVIFVSAGIAHGEEDAAMYTILPTIEKVLASIDSPQTENGWTFKATQTGKTLVLTSEYTG